MKPTKYHRVANVENRAHHPRRYLQWAGALAIVLGSIAAAFAFAGLVFQTPSPNILNAKSQLASPAGPTSPITPSQHSEDTSSDDQFGPSQPINARPSAAPSSLSKVGPSGEGEAVSPEAIVAAFNCARTKGQLEAYKREVSLDQQAHKILQRVIANPNQPLRDFEQGFTLTGQLVLDAAYPVLSECMVGGFDVAQVGRLEKSSRIGVAVAPLAQVEHASRAGQSMEPSLVHREDLYLTIVVGY